MGVCLGYSLAVVILSSLQKSSNFFALNQWKMFFVTRSKIKNRISKLAWIATALYWTLVWHCYGNACLLLPPKCFPNVLFLYILQCSWEKSHKTLKPRKYNNLRWNLSSFYLLMIAICQKTAKYSRTYFVACWIMYCKYDSTLFEME